MHFDDNYLLLLRDILFKGLYSLTPKVRRMELETFEKLALFSSIVYEALAVNFLKINKTIRLTFGMRLQISKQKWCNKLFVPKEQERFKVKSRNFVSVCYQNQAVQDFVKDFRSFSKENEDFRGTQKNFLNFPSKNLNKRIFENCHKIGERLQNQGTHNQNVPNYSISSGTVNQPLERLEKDSDFEFETNLLHIF